jgi:hypothetical protein
MLKIIADEGKQKRHDMGLLPVFYYFFLGTRRELDESWSDDASLSARAKWDELKSLVSDTAKVSRQDVQKG